MRRDYVASTLIRRHFGTKCPLGQWAFGAKMTSYQRRCDVITSHRVNTTSFWHQTATGVTAPSDLKSHSAFLCIEKSKHLGRKKNNNQGKCKFFKNPVRLFQENELRMLRRNSAIIWCKNYSMQSCLSYSIKTKGLGPV